MAVATLGSWPPACMSPQSKASPASPPWRSGVLEQLSRRVERVAVYRPVVRRTRRRTTSSTCSWPTTPSPVLRRMRGRDLRRAPPMTRTPRSTASSIATTRWPRRPTPCWWWAATTPTWARPPSSPSTSASRPTSARPCFWSSTPTGSSPEAVRTAADSRSPSCAPATAPCSPSSPTVPTRGIADVVAALAGLDVPAFAIPDEPLLSAPSVGRPDGRLRGRSGQRRGAAAGPGGDRRGGRGDDAAACPGPALRRGRRRHSGRPPEVVLGVLTAHASATFPQISGIVLNGGFPLPPR